MSEPTIVTKQKHTHDLPTYVTREKTTTHTVFAAAKTVGCFGSCTELTLRSSSNLVFFSYSPIYTMRTVTDTPQIDEFDMDPSIPDDVGHEAAPFLATASPIAAEEEIENNSEEPDIQDPFGNLPNP